MKVTILFVALLPLIAAKTGSVEIQGQLLCMGEPVINETVRIYEKNIILSDTLLLTDKTDPTGSFSLKVSTSDFLTKPRPYLYIVNYCTPYKSPSWMKCGRSLKFYVPEYFVTDGHLPKTTYNLQKIELSTVKNEKQGLERAIYFYFDHIECVDV